MNILHPENLKANLDQTIQNDLEQHIIGGASIWVAQNNQTVYCQCYGESNTDTHAPLLPNTLFRLASMTKPVTAAAALMQIQRGKLNLDDPVSKYIPAFKHKMVGRWENDKVVADHPAAEEIQLVHLLTHTSGLLSADPNVGLRQPIPAEAYQTLETIVNYYGEHIFLSTSPMELALYSATAAFDVAARLVEITADMPYEEFLRTNLFDPLEMPDTTFSPNEEQWGRMVGMHIRTEEGNAVDNRIGRHTFENFPLTYCCGGASLASTIVDYSHFASMLLNEGSYNGRQILSPEMIALMRYPRIPQTVAGIGGGETWGLGVRVITGSPALPRGSFGWSGAYGTHFWVDPTNAVTAIYMKNSRFDGGSGAQTARRFEQAVMSSFSH